MLSCGRALVCGSLTQVIRPIHGCQPACLGRSPFPVGPIGCTHEVAQEKPPQDTWRIDALHFHQDCPLGCASLSEDLCFDVGVLHMERQHYLCPPPTCLASTRAGGEGLLHRPTKARLPQGHALARLLEPELRSHRSAIEMCLHAKPSVTCIYKTPQ